MYFAYITSSKCLSSILCERISTHTDTSTSVTFGKKGICALVHKTSKRLFEALTQERTY